MFQCLFESLDCNIPKVFSWKKRERCETVKSRVNCTVGEEIKVHYSNHIHNTHLQSSFSPGHQAGRAEVAEK